MGVACCNAGRRDEEYLPGLGVLGAFLVLTAGTIFSPVLDGMLGSLGVRRIDQIGFSAMALEDNLVAIFPLDGKAPLGAGLLVERALVLTCAHVVNSALGREGTHTQRPSGRVDVKLHTSPHRVKAFVDSGHDAWSAPPATRGPGADLCLLRLDPASESEVKPVRLMVLADLATKKFRVAGYPKGWDVDYSSGEIVGKEEHGLYMLRPEPTVLAMVGGQTRSSFLGGGQRLPGIIYKGFSGGPVEVEGQIAGLLAEARGDVSEATSYMIPAAAFPERILKNAVSRRDGLDSILTLAADVLNSLRELDNAIRGTVGHVTRFDHTWSQDARETAIREMEVLADTEVILPKVRQLLAQLGEARERAFDMNPERVKTVDVLLKCGQATLESLGQSDVTPWPGPHELSTLIHAIRTANTPEAAESVRQNAQKVILVVDRKLLREADGLLGRLKGKATQ